MTTLKNAFTIATPILFAALVVAIVVEDQGTAYEEEYTYKEYEALSRDRYTSFKKNIITELKARLNLVEKENWQNDYYDNLKMTSSQFEGPQVHLERLVYNGESLSRDSVAKNGDSRFAVFDIHNLQFDPDHPHTGKPDIKVEVTAPKPYQEQRNATLQGIFDKISGGSDRTSPYKTYTKEVFSVRDSTIVMENIQMDLWLTEFDVTVETKSWTHRPDDPDDSRAEIANQRHHPFEIMLKILPNVSPWYVNTGSSFDKKADMAVGAIYCKGITKWPRETTSIGVTPGAVGLNLPLVKQDYYNGLENPELLFESKVSDRTIWNKPLYARITFTDIGSYRRFLSEKGDEKIQFSFLMPLLMRGSWDVQIPASIVPEYDPSPPYRRSFASIMLPKWGLGILGAGLSALIYLAVVGLVVMRVVLKII